jgi:hypothetical protein
VILVVDVFSQKSQNFFLIKKFKKGKLYFERKGSHHWLKSGPKIDRALLNIVRKKK